MKISYSKLKFNPHVSEGRKKALWAFYFFRLLRIDISHLFLGDLRQSENHSEILKSNFKGNNNIELTGKLRLGGAEHFYMEPHSVIVIPEEKDELIVHFR